MTQIGTKWAFRGIGKSPPKANDNPHWVFDIDRSFNERPASPTGNTGRSIVRDIATGPMIVFQIH
jgi:hypothetical protein